MKKSIFYTLIIFFSSTGLMAQPATLPAYDAGKGHITMEVFSSVNFNNGPVMPGIGANLHYQKNKHLFTAGITAYADLSLLQSENREFRCIYLMYGLAKRNDRWALGVSGGPGWLTETHHTSTWSFFGGQPLTGETKNYSTAAFVFSGSAFYQPKRFGIGLTVMGNINPVQCNAGLQFGARYRFGR